MSSCLCYRCCTRGIRCEMAPILGQKVLGLRVFFRISVGSLDTSIMGPCLICGSSYGNYSSRCRCTHCRMLVLISDSCQIHYMFVSCARNVVWILELFHLWKIHAPPPENCKRKYAWLVVPDFGGVEADWKIANQPFDPLQYQQQTDGFDVSVSLAYTKKVFSEQGPFDEILDFQRWLLHFIYLVVIQAKTGRSQAIPADT
ncbi:hypothetical protein V6N11_046896 [Hibiscus sabdariffa]|uniref:Uncharacterized protein n=2 Tax=Hibiscus sabdariffa TaxID=183260 RepID=A0ABR2NCU0_9ROSI